MRPSVEAPAMLYAVIDAFGAMLCAYPEEAAAVRAYGVFLSSDSVALPVRIVTYEQTAHERETLRETPAAAPAESSADEGVEPAEPTTVFPV